MERNLHDCLAVAKNIFVNPKLVPGGGAIEMEVSSHLERISSSIEGLHQLPFRAGMLNKKSQLNNGILVSCLCS